MQLRVLILIAGLGLVHAKILKLSCDDIRRFVDGHNARRLKLARGLVRGQPAAAEMKMMVWDEELAAKAAKWARKNTFEHNPDKTIRSQRFSCGENLFWYATTDQDYQLDPDKALEDWFQEHNDFTHKTLDWEDFSTGNQIGHYTQMAWGDTTFVGCAISEYMDDRDWKNFLVVCNYGPQGNFIGEEPYKTGRACKKLTCQGSHCDRKYGKRC